MVLGDGAVLSLRKFCLFSAYRVRVFCFGLRAQWQKLSGKSTVAEFHRLLQISLGSSNAHLHRFHVHGVSHGEYRPGGSLFMGDG
jgi:hypothetical protein